MKRVVVAFSGGVDSALLAWAAADVLGDRAVAATAVSPSLAKGELEHCRQLAKEWKLNWIEVTASEMDLKEYRANQLDRCYWCKASLMEALSLIEDSGIDADAGSSMGEAPILLGVNLDDLSDHRPGIDAAKQRGALFPFLDAEMNKQDIRDISQQLGLKTWDKPAEPCLASRIPFGTKVSVKILSSIDIAEAGLKKLGFSNVRIRHFGKTARVEIPREHFPALFEKQEAVVKVVLAAGYESVSLDLRGLKSGSLLPDSLRAENSRQQISKLNA